MVFMGVILQTTPGARKAHDICRRITRRLDLWEIGQYSALCVDTVAESQSQPTRITWDNNETEARTFKYKVVNGKIRAVVRGILVQENSRVLFPGDV